MLTDTIVALASAPGRAALAVVRLSGAGAFAVASRVVSGFRTDRPRLATLATFQDAAGQPIDRGLYITYPGPTSYTGEDAVELTCHGGPTVTAALVAALGAAGARPAAPGEFTRRAVLNGKLDLLQAEGVAELVDASSPASARAALHLVEGGLSNRIGLLRIQLLELIASLSYDIDFPGEDDGPIGPERLADLLREVTEAVGRLLRTAPAGERLRSGALVVLAGPPNSGKSSLFNALLGSDRALVAAMPGTTRDAIEADTTFLGWPIRLADTAGLRPTDDRVEQMGIEVSRRYMSGADLILFCAEAGRAQRGEERDLLAGPHALVVRTKSDLSPRDADGKGVRVSVVTGEGLDLLRQAIVARVFVEGEVGPSPDLEPLLLRERHQDALRRASESLQAATALQAADGDAALVAHEVQQAMLALDEMLGVAAPDEVLGVVFGRFCVGK